MGWPAHTMILVNREPLSSQICSAPASQTPQCQQHWDDDAHPGQSLEPHGKEVPTPLSSYIPWHHYFKSC